MGLNNRTVSTAKCHLSCDDLGYDKVDLLSDIRYIDENYNHNDGEHR